jgi:hypothetical protein
MGQNLTGQTIASTYEDLVQISGSLRNILTDGTGSEITSLDVTASNAVSSSYAVTASFALNVPTVDTGSLMVTGSVSSNTLTFTKGDGSTFDLTVNTGSAVTVDTGSLMVTGSVTNNTLTFTKGDGSTFDLTVNTGSAVTTDTGSLLVTASISDATITFTKGDASTFDITVNNVENAFTSSYVATAVLTGSVSSNTLTFTKFDGSTFDLTVDTGSIPSFDTGSLLVTASISDATTTYTKGDGSTFDLTVNNVQNASTASIAVTATTASAVDTTPADDNVEYAITFVAEEAAGTQVVRTDDNSNITFNPTTAVLSVPTLNGNATTATSASYALTASYAENAAAVDTGSFYISSSVSNATITFNQGDGSTEAVTVDNVQNAVSASYAATASFVDLGTSATASFTGSTWVFDHNLNADYIVVDCYDANEEEIIPQTIDLTTANQATITFPVSVQGTAVASLGNGVTIASITNNITNVTQSFTNTNPISTLGYNLGAAYTASLYTQRLEITAAGTYSLDVSASGPHYIDCTGLASGTGASVNVYIWADAFASMSANEGAVVTSEAGVGSGTYITYRTIVTASAGTGYWSSATTIGGTNATISRNSTLPRRDWGGGSTNPWVISKTLSGDVVLSNTVSYQNTISYKFSGNQGTPI